VDKIIPSHPDLFSKWRFPPTWERFGKFDTEESSDIEQSSNPISSNIPFSNFLLCNCLCQRELRVTICCLVLLFSRSLCLQMLALTTEGFDLIDSTSSVTKRHGTET